MKFYKYDITNSSDELDNNIVCKYKILVMNENMQVTRKKIVELQVF